MLFLSSGTALLLQPMASYVASIASRSHKAISSGKSVLTKRSQVVQYRGETCWLACILNLIDLPVVHFSTSLQWPVRNEVKWNPESECEKLCISKQYI